MQGLRDKGIDTAE